MEKIIKMISNQELRYMYWVQWMSQSDIAEKIGISQQTIGYWMKRYGIKTRTDSESKLNGIHVPPKKELHDMYCVQGMPTTKIAKKIGVSQQTISNWMKACGIETRTHSESMFLGSRRPPKEELYNMYWVHMMSQSEIAKKIGVTSKTVFNCMKEYEIETRTYSKAQLNGNRVGEKSGGWRGGISFEPYCQKFNNKFKEAVRERDDYICQLCGSEQNGRKLDVHHIHYDKKNCYPDVVALCRSCNSRVNANRDYWEEYFENELITRGLFCWSISNA